MKRTGRDATIEPEAPAQPDAVAAGNGHTVLTGEPVSPDIESALLSVVAQLVRPGDFDRLLERYRTAKTPQVEMRSLGALSTFPDVELCLRTFDLAMTEVRSKNGFAVIAGLLANPVGNQAVWTRLTEQWDAALERFPKNAPPRMLEAIPALCADAGFADGVQAFLRDHPLSSGPRRVAQSAERLQVNVAFAARERPRLQAALRPAATSAG